MQKYFVTTCLLIAGAVLINSMHGKDVLVAIPLATTRSDKGAHVQETEAKIGLELHNHVDKAGKVFTDNPQADTRSLRLRDLRRAIRQNPLLGLFSSWRDRLALYLG